MFRCPQDQKQQQELCEKYLARAREEISERDIPKVDDGAFYCALASKYLRRRRITYINVPNADIDLGRYLSPFFLSKLVLTMLVWLAAFVVATLFFRIWGFVLICVLYIVSIFVRFDVILDTDISRIDLKVAARCVAICEILERRSPDVCNDNWAGDPETRPGPVTDMKRRSEKI